MDAFFFLCCALFLFVRSEIDLILLGLFAPHRLMDRVSELQPINARGLFRLAGMLCGFRIEFGKTGVSLPPVFLIVANHQSLADIPALAASFPHHPMRFVAKKELGRHIPYVSRGLRVGRHALISRTSDFREGGKELKRFAALSRQGIVPVVFPEGTRSRSGAVQPFNGGAVRIILEQESLPVLSVAMDGGWRMATIDGLFRHLRGTRYRVKPLTLYPAPKGKREIIALIGKMEEEIRDQVDAWHAADAAQARGHKKTHPST